MCSSSTKSSGLENRANRKRERRCWKKSLILTSGLLNVSNWQRIVRKSYFVSLDDIRLCSRMYLPIHLPLICSSSSKRKKWADLMGEATRRKLDASNVQKFQSSATSLNARRRLSVFSALQRIPRIVFFTQSSDLPSLPRWKFSSQKAW